jgi:hypothetical protein
VRPRRSLVQHLRAIGRFLWRYRAAAVLLDAARVNLRRRIAQRGLAPADAPLADVVDLLARRFDLAPAAVSRALAGSAGTTDEFTASMATLAELERRINEKRIS